MEGSCLKEFTQFRLIILNDFRNDQGGGEFSTFLSVDYMVFFIESFVFIYNVSVSF